MMLGVLPVTALLFGGLAFAESTGDRAKLVGYWEQQGRTGTVWTIQNDGENLHLIQTENGQKVSDFECNTLGRECTVKNSGKGSKVSMWYYGPKLVVMEMRGNDVVKHRFHAVEGDQMQLEVIPIVPSGKPETISLVRRTQSAATKP